MHIIEKAREENVQFVRILQGFCKKTVRDNEVSLIFAQIVEKQVQMIAIFL